MGKFTVRAVFSPGCNNGLLTEREIGTEKYQIEVF